MATNKIRVTPEQLKAKALSMGESAKMIQDLTQSMTSTVTAVSGNIWSGNAQASYVAKFNQLQQDVNNVIKLVNNHVSHLNSIATEYESAEAKNIAAVNKLSSKVIK